MRKVGVIIGDHGDKAGPESQEKVSELLSTRLN